MSLSMIYMFLSMSYYWTWLTAAWQMWFFIASSLAIGGYLVTMFVRGQSVNFLWILLLVQQAAMAYMWFPMMGWNAIVIFVLVSWFAIETFGWAANLLPDDVRKRENRPWFPHEVVARRTGAQRIPARQPAKGGAATLPSTDTEASIAADCHTSDCLIASGWKDRTLMAIMALSMGYMFYGMQLLAMTVPSR